MTIDECIDIWTYPSQYWPTKREEAVDYAIKIMRRYKKIADIMADNLDDIHPLDRQPYRLFNIHAVLLEGRND